MGRVLWFSLVALNRLETELAQVGYRMDVAKWVKWKTGMQEIWGCGWKSHPSNRKMIKKVKLPWSKLEGKMKTSENKGILWEEDHRKGSENKQW